MSDLYKFLCSAIKKRTTDNAAGRQAEQSPGEVAPSTGTAGSSPAPAAPTQTPWISRIVSEQYNYGEYRDGSDGVTAQEAYDSMVGSLELFARRLEDLVHRQHEALVRWQQGHPFMLVRRDEALAAYAEFEKEAKRG